MWTMLLLLWSVPPALGIFILARVAQGRPALKENESQLLFGASKETMLSPWMALEFVVLALLFLILGFFEGLVLANLGAIWLAVVLPMTALGAMWILVCWLRAAPEPTRVPQNNTARAAAIQSRIADLIHALNSYRR